MWYCTREDSNKPELELPGVLMVGQQQPFVNDLYIFYKFVC